MKKEEKEEEEEGEKVVQWNFSNTNEIQYKLNTVQHTLSYARIMRTYDFGMGFGVQLQLKRHGY